MKKLVALLLGSAMLVTAAAGMAACKKEEETPSAARRPDPRAADAYCAYDNKGELVGSYKTIADAINATVNADLDFFEDESVEDATKGGYVTKKGSDFHLFDNRKGFAGNNSDCFWYYTNGTELTGFNCWDATNGVTTLQNAKIITHQTGNMGLTASQSWNGFGLLDAHGQLINSETTLPPTWEFSKPMDAGIMVFPARKKGVSGMKYKFNMSNVKITPAYEGVEDPVYAYMGFYAWQDYYVVGIGIACDTTTGDWYRFHCTSRDDSFSDATYKIGDRFMTSTWHDDENGGYFTPDKDTIEMEIKTVRHLDEFEEAYWVDEMHVKGTGGTGEDFTLDINLDDEYLNQLFAGLTVKADNGYAFIAGLDIKNPIVDGAAVANVDYFNGAKFENFVVEEAGVYFPSEEEMTDIEYSIATIDPELRGKYHDAVMANDEYTDGTIDYTYLYNYCCTSWEAKDGVDVYNFRFDGSPVSDQLIGGKLKEYQDKIDSLANMTPDNVSEYQATLDECTAWYGEDDNHTGSTVLQQYMLLIDWTHYHEALKVYEASLKLSDDAQKILDGLRALTPIGSYEYKGWQTDGTDVAGYLYSEVKKFEGYLAQYNALSSDDDKNNLIRLFGEGNFNTWKELSEDLNAFFSDSALLGKINLEIYKTPGSAEKVTYTGQDILPALAEWMFKIKKGGGFGEDADAAGAYDYGDGGAKVMNFDNTAFPSLWICAVVEYLNGVEGFEMPGYFLDVLDAIGFESFYEELYYPISRNVLLGARILGEKIDISELTEEEVAFLNEVWTNSYVLGGHIAWNWNSGDKFDTYYKNRMAKLVTYLDVDQTYTVKQCTLAIADFLASYGYTVKSNSWGVEEDEISNSPDNSDAAKAVAEAFNKISVLGSYEYKGWTTDGTEIAGYLYSETLAFREVQEDYNALSAREKIAVNSNITRANYVEWETFSDELAELEETELWSKKYSMLEKAYDSGAFAKKEYTAAEALAEIINISLIVKGGGKLSDAGDDEGGVAVLNGDKNFYTALRLVGFYHFFVSNDAKLPDYVLTLITAIKADEYYQNFFYPLYYTVQLAQHITDDSIAKIEDLSEEELAFLNEVWTSGYTLKDPMSAHWNEGNEYFNKWWKERVTYLVAIAGGTIEKDGQKITLHDYAVIVADFLKSLNYTIKDNGWGITGGKIAGVTLIADTIELVNEFNSNFTILPGYIGYKGWIAPEGEAFKGYFYSELEAFKTFYEKVEALPEGQEDGLAGLVDYASYLEWVAFMDDESIVESIEALKDASIELPATPYLATENKTYEGMDIIGELFAWLERIHGHTTFDTATENDDANTTHESTGATPGADVMRLGNNLYPSIRIQKILEYLDTLEEFELPAFIEDLLDAVAYDDFLEVYDAFRGTANLARKIEAGTVTKIADLTEEELAFLNKYWVNEYVRNDLIEWNWTSGNKFQMYYDARTKTLLEAAIGTLEKEHVSDYFDVVGAWLAGLGYTVKENGWGVTESEIK